jgi:hypothetical protein
MHSTDLADPRTTRRTVLKTGVTLAYTAPLVAACFKRSIHGGK